MEISKILNYKSDDILFHGTSDEVFNKFKNKDLTTFKYGPSTMGNGVCFSNSIPYCQAYCNKHIKEDPYETLKNWSETGSPILQIKLKQHKMIYLENHNYLSVYINQLRGINQVKEATFQEDMRDYHLKNGIKSIRVRNMYGYGMDEIVVFDKSLIKIELNRKPILGCLSF